MVLKTSLPDLNLMRIPIDTYYILHNIKIGPGPKYKLKTVVGYNDHCASRYRNPAYSIAARQTGGEMGCDGPGPIYYAELPRSQGFTIGGATRGGSQLT